MLRRSVCLIGVLIWSSSCLPQQGRGGEREHGKKHSERHVDRLQRAGNPHAVAWYAVPSVNKKYTAYYIGGGAAVRGEHRHPEEGTWGLDYLGSLFKRRIELRWWHGRHEQDGGGSYETDGPHVLAH